MRSFCILVFALLITGCGTPVEFKGEYYYAGIPKPSSSLNVLTNKGYAVGYFEDFKNPLWACYRLCATTNKAPARPSMKFKTDDRTEAKVSHDDYTNTGYDRGHMAPSYAMGLCYGEKAQKGTFIMSNVVPQAPNLNRGPWRALESSVADDMAQRFGEVWVITGPIFETGRDGRKRFKNGVVVPPWFFKIIVYETNGVPVAKAYMISQKAPLSANPEEYQTIIDGIEHLTNLDFFSELPDDVEQKLEGE